VPLLAIIDSCLSLDYMQRPQSVFALQKALMAAVPKPRKRDTLMKSLRKTLNKEIF
jgi:hypothetical protein